MAKIHTRYSNNAVTDVSLIDYPNKPIYFKLNWKKAHKFTGSHLDLYELYLRTQPKNPVDLITFRDFLITYNNTITNEMITKGTVFKLPDNVGIFYIFKKHELDGKYKRYAIDWKHYNETKEIKQMNSNGTEGYSCKIKFEPMSVNTQGLKVNWDRTMKKTLSYNMLYKNSYNFYHEKIKINKTIISENDN